MRDKLFVATKARVDSAAGTVASFERSLKLLRNNRVDLMQLHNPKDPNQDLAPYRDVDHPLQQPIAATLADVAQEPVAATAIDGCGAPVMAVSLRGLARAFARVAAADPDTACGRIASAMRAHPEYVGGTGRDVTALMQGTDGAIAKDGAEAVYAVGLADGRGIALKVADGGQRARPVILAAAMQSLGIDSDAYAALTDAPILGHGEVVGGIVATGF